MLLKFLGMLISLLACTSIYLSHPNQIFFEKPFPRPFLYIGLIGICMGLILLVYALPLLVAVCIWFAVLILVWSFVPFIALLQREHGNENRS